MTRHSGRVATQDIAAFALGLILLTAGVLFLSDGAVLFTRPFWVDEWLMVFIADRATPAQVIADLAAGADGGASLVHLSHWLLRVATGPLSPVVVRAMALACVLAALVVVFIVLRRRLSGTASAVGALAVGAHQLVVSHSYEGRFYGPWMLTAALVAWLLSRRQDARATGDSVAQRRAAVGLAAAAVALCTTHSYGVVSLGILSAGSIAAYGRAWRSGIRDAAPAAFGLLGLIIVVPLALGQRSAYAVPSWLPDFSSIQLWMLGKQLWFSGTMAAAAVALIGGVVVRWRIGGRERATAMVTRATSDAGIMALLALAVMPVVLAALSLLGQPSMLSRYAILTLLAWAPGVALAAEIAGRWAARALVVLIAWFWVAAYVRETAVKSSFAAGVRSASEAHERAQTTGLPVVVQSIHVMYPVTGPDPTEARSAFLDVPDSVFAALFPQTTRFGQLNRGTILERDLARVHFRQWGYPRLLSLAAADTTPRFLLLAPVERLPLGLQPVERYAQVMFPNHRLTRLLPELSLLELGPKPSSK